LIDYASAEMLFDYYSPMQVGALLSGMMATVAAVAVVVVHCLYAILYQQ
jgi:hypothetical protein